MTDEPVQVINPEDLEEGSSGGGSLSFGQICIIAGAVLLLSAALGLYILSNCFSLKGIFVSLHYFICQLRKAKM